MQIQPSNGYQYSSLRELMQSDTAKRMRNTYHSQKATRQIKGAIFFKTVSSLIIGPQVPLANTPAPVPIPVSPWIKQSAMIMGTTAAVGAVSAAMFANSPTQGAVIGAVGGAAGGAIIGHFINIGSKSLQYALPAGIGAISGAIGGYLVSQTLSPSPSSDKTLDSEKKTNEN